MRDDGTGESVAGDSSSTEFSYCGTDCRLLSR